MSHQLRTTTQKNKSLQLLPLTLFDLYVPSRNYAPMASTFTQNPLFSLQKDFSCGIFYIYIHVYTHTPKKNQTHATTKIYSINLTALHYFQTSDFTTRTRLTFTLTWTGRKTLNFFLYSPQKTAVCSRNSQNLVLRAASIHHLGK